MYVTAWPRTSPRRRNRRGRPRPRSAPLPSAIGSPPRWRRVPREPRGPLRHVPPLVVRPKLCPGARGVEATAAHAAPAGARPRRRGPGPRRAQRGAPRHRPDGGAPHPRALDAVPLRHARRHVGREPAAPHGRTRHRGGDGDRRTGPRHAAGRPQGHGHRLQGEAPALPAAPARPARRPARAGPVGASASARPAATPLAATAPTLGGGGPDRDVLRDPRRLAVGLARGAQGLIPSARPPAPP